MLLFNIKFWIKKNKNLLKRVIPVSFILLMLVGAGIFIYSIEVKKEFEAEQNLEYITITSAKITKQTVSGEIKSEISLPICDTYYDNYSKSVYISGNGKISKLDTKEMKMNDIAEILVSGKFLCNDKFLIYNDGSTYIAMNLSTKETMPLNIGSPVNLWLHGDNLYYDTAGVFTKYNIPECTSINIDTKKAVVGVVSQNNSIMALSDFGAGVGTRTIFEYDENMKIKNIDSEKASGLYPVSVNDSEYTHGYIIKGEKSNILKLYGEDDDTSRTITEDVSKYKNMVVSGNYLFGSYDGMVQIIKLTQDRTLLKNKEGMLIIPVLE